MNELRKLVARNIKKARLEAGLKQGELALKCGWGQRGDSRLGNYERAYSEPSAEDISKLARALKVEPAWFFKREEEATPNIVNIPVLDVKALEVRGYSEAKAVEHIALQKNQAPEGNLFALKITGGDLEPEFKLGAYVVVKPATAPVVGDFVVALVRGAVAVKKFMEDAGKRYLISLNTYPPIDASVDVKVVGVVVSQVFYKPYK